MQVILNITDRCNLNCSYCRIPKGSNIMEWDTVIGAYSLIKDDDVSIGFYGGEPLLVPGRVILAMEEAHIRFRQPRFNITTSGLYLTRSFLDLTADLDLRMTLSHDGTRQGITRYSYMMDSQERADAAARMMLDYDPFSVAMCTYRPQDIFTLKEDVDYLTDLGFRYISLNPDSYRKDWDYGRLEEVLVSIIEDNKDIHFINLESDSDCGDGNGFFVSTKGSIFPCISYSEIPKMCIGHVNFGIDRY